ncbi:MAG: RNA:NAD 2'-phosphotransferase [uncultured Microvirga sp.]|uniref:Probable RNA 2'-phosphotransferase n=1 Tax=uncultured Microvirga sp. TaxID=412392 RepID=A0A6J4MIW6_9HYPH|nr:MAG: RNA:NAD 2'-phosphotransferase [uncultured Microvirga sp.]
MPTASVRISKFLARILRHQPHAAGLNLDPNGWADIDAVLSAVTAKHGPVSFEQLVHLVETNDKRRYELSSDRRRIRAAQGHSIPVDLALAPAQPPPILYHGTQASSVPSVMRNGLLKGRRNHVHLSTDIETALAVGRRRSGDTAVLMIRSGDMTAHDFFLSANGVWLTDHVPPQFIAPLDGARLPSG